MNPIIYVALAVAAGFAILLIILMIKEANKPPDETAKTSTTKTLQAIN